MGDDKFSFVELCKHFLFSFNPRCEKEIVHLDTILAVPAVYLGGVERKDLRYFSHNFVNYLVNPSESLKHFFRVSLEKMASQGFFDWLDDWQTN